MWQDNRSSRETNSWEYSLNSKRHTKFQTVRKRKGVCSSRQAKNCTFFNTKVNARATSSKKKNLSSKARRLKFLGKLYSVRSRKFKGLTT